MGESQMLLCIPNHDVYTVGSTRGSLTLRTAQFARPSHDVVTVRFRSRILRPLMTSERPQYV